MNIIDLRDIYNEKESEPETYKKWFDAFGFNTDLEFLEQANNESTMIPEEDFEDYARELAEDLGLISNDTQWPATCIDWQRASEELAMDYSSITVDGVDYYYRAY